MRRLLSHKSYDVFLAVVGSQWLAMIQRPPRGITISEVPAVEANDPKAESTLKAAAKAAIERDLAR